MQQLNRIKRRILASPTDNGPHEEVPSPLTPDEVKSVESKLGFKLPTLLFEIYTCVGNGGVGPGFGILPLTAEDNMTFFETVLGLHESLTLRFGWDGAVVPFCSWGCGVYSCIDLISEDFQVYRFEPNIPQELTHQYLRGLPYRGPKLLPEGFTLVQWIDEWLSGKGELLFERMNAI
jgi:hypothetical protein